MASYDDDDREKLSWREIDRRRDRSRPVSEDRKSFRERSLKSDWARKQHLREAEKFFQGKKGSEAYKAAHAALHDKYGTADFQNSLESFLEQFGLPDEWGTLLLVLDSPKPERVKEALAAMQALYAQRSLMEQRGFKSKVKVLAMTTADKSVRLECERLLKK